MGPRRDGLKLFIAILLPFVVTYGVLELALRGFAGGEIAFFRTIVGETPTLFAVFKNPETRIRNFQFPVNPHEPDPYLAWKNRPNLRQEPYLTTSHGIYSPHEIAYERRAGVRNYRLLVLGDSSTAGLGIDKQSDTWTQVLQRALGEKVEVVNAAVIGYSSEQARTALLREYYKYKPDGILLYLGNNDGFGSRAPDRTLLEATKAPKSWFGHTETWLTDHSAIYVSLKMLAKFINRAFDTDFSDEALKFHRVPLDQSRENFDTMVRWGREAGADVYVVIPPVPLEYPPRVLEYDYRRSYDPAFIKRNGCLEPNKSPSDLLPAMLATDITTPRYPKYDLPIGRYAHLVLRCFEGRLDEQRQRFATLVKAGSTDPNVHNNYGYVLARTGDPQAATASFLKAIELAPQVPHFHYNAGMNYRQLGEEEKGLAQLQAALDLDFTSARIQSPYVAELKKMAGSDSRIVLIDAATVFHGCDNETLFADHVHPNEKGQALVARIVARTLAARLGAAPAGAICGS
jgi:lysophospholipase L1-like esterase